ncbi:phosphatidylserine decarboxylase proenzyme-like protein [Mollisia scopiformis]|uniref:Phosphatidylserine decarboxylase proenzyme-like protein n=1 Tax=Mollisia scopiformis TaxID=149040 RepID=A0A132BCP5_MOLSC|nr:phosphatidylserine decarboxylase proenzyme-like protein [Mollisia scopiformis]KUJ10166.1 phosphatidylserine decarboxylase proenzyme-like protein [Mollisia scopiformis]
MAQQKTTPGSIPATLKLPRCGEWLPQDTTTLSSWLSAVIKHVDANPKPLVPVLQEFQSVIENDAKIFMLFHQMFTQIPRKKPYWDDPTGQPQVRHYQHMLQLFNHILTTAPEYNDTGLVGFPINAILDWPMGTPAGVDAFLNPEVNLQFKNMLAVWSDFLMSSKSKYVLNTSASGWLGTAALSAMQTTNQGSSFVSTFECQPTQEFYGYTSWDDFFTRQFKPDARPVALPNDDTVITNACESAPYRIATNVSKHSKFWIKAQPYSLFHMLNNDEYAPRFVGGTIYQAFLSALSYHRWHSPVNGTIVKTCLVPGTYYSETQAEGFAFSEIDDYGRSTTEKATQEPDPAGPNDSQGYITAVATRALIFIQADSKDIGLMCFMAIGMAEVSTCDTTVRVGQKVKKGDQLGMFHFGGSTHCLFFRPEVKLVWDMHGQDGNVGLDSSNIRINERIATVVTKDGKGPVFLPPSIPK